MKRTRLLTAALSLVAVSAVAHAANERVLQRRYTKGLVETYAIKGTLSEGPGGAPEPFAISATTDLHMTVTTVAVAADGSASQKMMIVDGQETIKSMTKIIETTFKDGRMTLKINGKPQDRGELYGGGSFGQPLAFRFDARGRPLETAPIASDSSSMCTMDPVIVQIPAILPKGPATAGDSWLEKIKLPVYLVDSRKAELPMKYTYMFVGFEQYQDRQVARLNFKGSGVVRAGGADNPAASLALTMSGYELFDYDAGTTLVRKVRMEQTNTGPAIGAAPVTSGYVVDYYAVRQ